MAACEEEDGTSATKLTSHEAEARRRAPPAFDAAPATPKSMFGPSLTLVMAICTPAATAPDATASSAPRSAADSVETLASEIDALSAEPESRTAPGTTSVPDAGESEEEASADGKEDAGGANGERATVAVQPMPLTA